MLSIVNEEKTSVSPRFLTVQNGILKALCSGLYPVDSALPPHTFWANRFEVSTFLISQAFQFLRHEKIIESVRGSGTFLRKIPPKELLEQGAGKIRPKSAIHLWVVDSRNLRKMRGAVVRHRFQDEFRRRHPEIEIEEQTFNLPSEAMEAKQVQALLNREGPTLGHTTATLFPTLIDYGALRPLDASELPEPVADQLKAIQERLDPQCLRICSTPSLYADGSTPAPAAHPRQLYLLPSGMTYSFLIYSKEKFAQAGIDPHHPPRDWGEFLEFARRLAKANHGRPSFYLSDLGTFCWWLLQLGYQCLPAPLSTASAESCPSLPVFGWNDPRLRPALELFVKMFAAERLLRVATDEPALFEYKLLAGQLPMVMGTNALAMAILEEKAADRFGLAPLPNGPNGQIISQLNCGGWFVDSRATPDQYSAAIRYLLEWQELLNFGGGYAQINRSRSRDLFSSVFRRRDSPAMPSHWQWAHDQLRQHAFLEARESDWTKIILAQAIKNLLAGELDQAPDAVQQYLHFHFRHEGLGGVESFLSSFANQSPGDLA